MDIISITNVMNVTDVTDSIMNIIDITVTTDINKMLIINITDIMNT